jgi:copper(I)-binding protein
MTVAAGGELTMLPGAMHIMCIRPDRDFVEGETIPFELTMASGQVLAGTATIENR